MFVSTVLRVAAMATLLAISTAAVAQMNDEDAPEFPTAALDEDLQTAEVSAGDLTARITVEKVPGEDPTLDFPVLRVLVKGAEVLRAVGAGASFPAAEASIAEIDTGNASAEVYFTSHTGGVNCCARVIVASTTDTGWTATEVGEFDGDGDYLEDADGDGTAEIVTIDNRFLYRFDCGACSAAPLMVLTVRSGTVTDLSSEPRFRGAHLLWLEQIEDETDPVDRWSSPGFLAGWVATRIRLGEGDAAWRELTENWDLKKDRGATACLTGAELDKCPRKSRKTLKFPERLKIFLDANGYAF